MSDKTIHSDDPGFEDFVKRELLALEERAKEDNICNYCLSDRIIVEMVASLTRAGISPKDILSMVLDGMELADDEEGGHSHRMH